MKKAFTLIELLVVIAIIAILAAILFPVFAQAKAAAKKTSALSNQKQIGTGVQLYMGDSDDILPRNDDCIANSSLNPALNTKPYAPAGVGCRTAPFFYRVNHYAWQKWVMPYVKNVQLFEHPGKSKDATNWADSGQIMNGMAINIALTGQLDTYGNTDPNRARQFRNSWTGGSLNALPNVSGAMLLMEFPSTILNFAPGITRSSDNGKPTVTVYPTAIKEFWANLLMKRKPGSGCGTMNDVTGEPNANIFAGGIVMGFADSSAKFVPAGRFIAQTPTAAEYGLVGDNRLMCGDPTGSSLQTATTDVVNLNINYPMWGLGQ